MRNTPLRDTGYCALLLPRAVHRLIVPGRRGPALLTLLLGVAALVPLGIDLLGLLRGVLYGIVDPGPYDTSWGGPSRAGAWAAHFLISLPFVAAATAALVGIAALHRRLGERPTAGLIGTALAVPVPAVVLVVAWLHQI